MWCPDFVVAHGDDSLVTFFGHALCRSAREVRTCVARVLVVHNVTTTE